MKNSISYVLTFLFLTCALSCTEESTELVDGRLASDLAYTQKVDPSSSILEHMPEVVREIVLKATYQGIEDPKSTRTFKYAGETTTSDVTDLMTSEVTGSCSVKRSSKGTDVHFRSEGLTPGDAVTIWTVVLSPDENCELIFTDFLVGGGKVIDDSGILDTKFFIPNGDNSRSTFEEFCLPGPGPGIEDAYEASLHFFTRTHGPYIEGSDQLTSFSDCNPDNYSIDCLDGTEVAGSCYDLHESFNPVNCPVDVCQTPRDLRVTKQSGNSFQLQWSRGPNNVAKYELVLGYQGESGTFSTITLRNNKVNISASQSKTIEVKVRALCAMGEVSDYCGTLTVDLANNSHSFEKARMVNNAKKNFTVIKKISS